MILYTCQLLGREFITNDERMFKLMKSDDRDFHVSYPMFVPKVIECLKELDARQVPATVVTYFSYRLQAWAAGFDAEPSTPITLYPADVTARPAVSSED